jgi:hypothetical protein
VSVTRSIKRLALPLHSENHPFFVYTAFIAMSFPVVSMVDPSLASIPSEAGRDRGRAASLSRPHHTKRAGGRKQACLSCRRRKRKCDVGQFEP